MVLGGLLGFLMVFERFMEGLGDFGVVFYGGFGVI